MISKRRFTNNFVVEEIKILEVGSEMENCHGLLKGKDDAE
jgi:hypothetical protein